LCRVVGIFGAHKFYLGKPLEGVLYVVTFGGFAFGWFYDICTMERQVRRFNLDRARVLADEIRGLPPSTPKQDNRTRNWLLAGIGLFAAVSALAIIVGLIGKALDQNAPSGSTITKTRAAGPTTANVASVAEQAMLTIPGDPGYVPQNGRELRMTGKIEFAHETAEAGATEHVFQVTFGNGESAGLPLVTDQAITSILNMLAGAGKKVSITAVVFTGDHEKLEFDASQNITIKYLPGS
jgi:hypothetical protein